MRESKKDKNILASPGEARTHNPGIALQCTVYKYRALTDCATGEHLLKAAPQYQAHNGNKKIMKNNEKAKASFYLQH